MSPNTPRNEVKGTKGQAGLGGNARGLCQVSEPNEIVAHRGTWGGKGNAKGLEHREKRSGGSNVWHVNQTSGINKWAKADKIVESQTIQEGGCAGTLDMVCEGHRRRKLGG